MASKSFNVIRIIAFFPVCNWKVTIIFNCKKIDGYIKINGDFNKFYRIDRPEDGSDEYTAWLPLGAVNYHVPQRFWELVFE